MELLEDNQLENLQNQFKIVVEELNLIKKQREEKAALKKAGLERKRLPKRQPLTSQIYELLIQSITGKSYQAERLRIAFCLLTVTGIKINELLPLKVYQLEGLIQSHWIAINRSKRGPASNKAFLIPEGKRIVKDRQQDFELLFLMKESDSYIFTSTLNHDKPFRHESITRSINNKLHCVSAELPDKPNITSYSFRVGYITQLWKDKGDIEFVRQAIGHIKVQSTIY